MTSFQIGQAVTTTHGIPTVPYGTTGTVEGVIPFTHGILIRIRDEAGKVHEVNAIYVKSLSL